MGLLGILVALGLLIWLAYRGWSVLLLAPAAALVAAGLAGEPLLAHWTQSFMASAARFVMQFFPIFLLGAIPSIAVAVIPLVIVIGVNLLMSLFLLPRLNASFLADEAWGSTSLSAVGGVWAVVTALTSAIITLIALNYQRLPALRASIDAGVNASALPVLSVASLVGFGSVVAALPAFGMVRDWVLSIEGGPLVSLAVATNVLASLTGSASGGLTIALDALGSTYMRLAAEEGIDPGLMHRVAVIGAGTLDSLPHNGAVVSLLAVCNSTHRESYFDIVMVSIIGGLLGLIAVIGLGTVFGSF